MDSTSLPHASTTEDHRDLGGLRLVFTKKDEAKKVDTISIFFCVFLLVADHPVQQAKIFFWPSFFF